MKNKFYGKKIRRLLEAAKPQMISDIENCFGDMIWHREWDYEPNERDMQLMFDIINNGIFGNRLSNAIPKVVLRQDLISTAPAKYRGMEQALAAFSTGMVKGQPCEMIMVKHLKKDNFFIIMCAMIHEMIHMYDYHFGPMRGQLERYGALCGYNLNYLPPNIDPKRVTPLDFQIANREYAMRAGFDIKQLPDEIQKKIEYPMLDTHPRQYCAPGEPARLKTRDGRIVLTGMPRAQKYTMSNLNGFYDVHGSYFKSFADTANKMGFAITDVFTGAPEEMAMRKVFEAESTPQNAAEALYAFFDSDHKAMVYEDPDNWYVEIF